MGAALCPHSTFIQAWEPSPTVCSLLRLQTLAGLGATLSCPISLALFCGIK